MWKWVYDSIIGRSIGAWMEPGPRTIWTTIVLGSFLITAINWVDPLGIGTRTRSYTDALFQIGYGSKLREIPGTDAPYNEQQDKIAIVQLINHDLGPCDDIAMAKDHKPVSCADRDILSAEYWPVSYDFHSHIINRIANDNPKALYIDFAFDGIRQHQKNAFDWLLLDVNDNVEEFPLFFGFSNHLARYSRPDGHNRTANLLMDCGGKLASAPSDPLYYPMCEGKEDIAGQSDKTKHEYFNRENGENPLSANVGCTPNQDSPYIWRSSNKPQIDFSPLYDECKPSQPSVASLLAREELAIANGRSLGGMHEVYLMWPGCETSFNWVFESETRILVFLLHKIADLLTPGSQSPPTGCNLYQTHRTAEILAKPDPHCEPNEPAPLFAGKYVLYTKNLALMEREVLVPGGEMIYPAINVHAVALENLLRFETGTDAIGVMKRIDNDSFWSIARLFEAVAVFVALAALHGLYELTLRMFRKKSDENEAENVSEFFLPVIFIRSILYVLFSLIFAFIIFDLSWRFRYQPIDIVFIMTIFAFDTFWQVLRSIQNRVNLRH